MKRLLLVSAFALLVIFPIKTWAQWTTGFVDTAGTVGRKCAIAVDGTGNPHISYRDGTVGWRLKYAHWNGTEWQTAFVETSESVYGVTSIALDDAGNPHIAFEKDWYGGHLWHAWWDGSDWQQEVVDGVMWVDIGEWNSIAFDTDGYPHIAYTYYDGDCYLKHAYKDASGWHHQVADSLLGDEFQFVSMALDNSSHPHISYYDYDVYDLKYAWLETTPLDTLWTKSYGGVNGDGANGVQTMGDGYLIVGTTRSFGAGNQDLWLIKTNEQGDALQTYTYGGWGNDRARGDMEETSDGGYIIGGTTHSFSPDGTHAMWLVKLDSTGSIQWDKSFSTGQPYDYGKGGARQTFDGGYILCGESCTSGHATIVFFAVKTDSLGAEEWRNTYGNSKSGCRSVVQTPDSGFIFVGFTNASGAGGNDVYLVRTKSNGDTLWTKTYGGGESDGAKSIQQTLDGNYIVAGGTSSFGSGVWVLKIAPNGDTLWTKVYDYWYSSGANDIEVTQDNGYIITGNCRVSSSDSLDVFLIKTNPSGDTLWTKTCGGNHNDGASSVIQTPDGGYVVAGGTQSYGEPNGDSYLVKFGSGEFIWHVERVDTTGRVGTCSSIALDSLDYPHIAYMDGTNTGVKYARWDGSDWQIETVESDIGYGFYTSLALDANDCPHISSAEYMSDLRFAYWDGSDWQIEVVDNTVCCGWTSLAIDGCGYCHIAYYNDEYEIYALKYAKRSPTTGVEEISIPMVFHLAQNYPNPFQSSTSIKYSLPKSSNVKLQIYNIKGQLVKTLVDAQKPAGYHTVAWNVREVPASAGTGMSSGIYFYKLETDNGSIIKKMLLVR